MEISSTAIPFEVRLSKTVGPMDQRNGAEEIRCESPTVRIYPVVELLETITLKI